jgi:hypothetical protein
LGDEHPSTAAAGEKVMFLSCFISIFVFGWIFFSTAKFFVSCVLRVAQKRLCALDVPQKSSGLANALRP